MQTRHGVLGSASWTRGKVSKARMRLVTSRWSRIQAPSSSMQRGKMALILLSAPLAHVAWQDGGDVLLLSAPLTHQPRHTACASDADRSTSAILPRCMLELGARIRHHRLVTSRIRAFDIFPLVHEAPPSTPCLVCMLSRPKVYFARAPFETRICSSLGKSGL